MLLAGLLGTSLIGGLVVFMLKDRKTIGYISALSSVITLIFSLLIVYSVVSNGSIGQGLLYIDGLSIYIILITSFMFLSTTVYSLFYIDTAFNKGLIDLNRFKLYYGLLQIFIFTLIFTCSSENLGMIWIGLGSTTLASAALVGLYKNERAMEAAWKYTMICSVGMAFALLGIAIIYSSSVSVFGEGLNGLNWTFLIEHGKDLNPQVIKYAFILVLLGYGAKAGLVPMHTWVPDVHSHAPAPINALLSTALLNTAVYGIIRIYSFARVSVGGAFAGELLIIFGLLSIGIGALFLLTQKEYRNILAYSSIEHMGIIALGLGVGSSLTIVGSILHIFFHSLGKSLLFFTSGNVYLRYGEEGTERVSGLFAVAPITAWGTLIGFLSIVGFPGASTFLSEFYICSGAFKSSHMIVPIIMLGFLSIAFAGLIRSIIPTLLGAPPSDVKVGEVSTKSTCVLVPLIILVVLLCFYMPKPMKVLLDIVIEIVKCT